MKSKTTGLRQYYKNALRCVAYCKAGVIPAFDANTALYYGGAVGIIDEACRRDEKFAAAMTIEKGTQEAFARMAKEQGIALRTFLRRLEIKAEEVIASLQAYEERNYEKLIASEMNTLRKVARI